MLPATSRRGLESGRRVRSSSVQNRQNRWTIINEDNHRGNREGGCLSLRRSTAALLRGVGSRAGATWRGEVIALRRSTARAAAVYTAAAVIGQPACCGGGNGQCSREPLAAPKRWSTLSGLPTCHLFGACERARTAPLRVRHLLPSTWRGRLAELEQPSRLNPRQRLKRRIGLR